MRASAHLTKNECILVVVGVDGRILTSARRTIAVLPGTKSADIRVEVKKTSAAERRKKWDSSLGFWL